MSLNRLAKLDADLLLALDALLAEPNVTRAAARLGIRQSALSARLTRLRSIFGDRLFVPAPSGRGVLPTPRALALRPLLTATLASLGEMVEPSDRFDAATSARTFTIALHENPAVMLTPDLVPRVGAAAPGARLSLVTPAATPRMAELLEGGEVDLFVALRSAAHGAWMSRTLFSYDFLTAQRPGHPRGGGPLDLDRFCALEHLLVSADGGGFAGFVDEALAALGRGRRVAVSVQSYALAPTIVAATDLLCTLPRPFLRRFAAQLDLFEPPLPLRTAELVACWHPRHHEDAGHAWLREQVFAAAAAAVRG